MKNIREKGYIIQKRTLVTFSKPEKLEGSVTGLPLCPHCGAPLTDSYALIPIANSDTEAKVSGRHCHTCDVLFVSHPKKIRSLLIDNLAAKSFTFDGKPMWNYSRERQKEQFLQKLASSPSSEVMIRCKFENGKGANYIIVSEEKDADAVRRIHYTSTEGRELLSAAFAPQRKGRVGKLNGMLFHVRGELYPVGKIPPKGRTPAFVLDELIISEGGGYACSAKQGERVLDVLLYSVVTERYEIISATYNEWRRECFVDRALYKAFQEKYGDAALSPYDRDAIKDFSEEKWRFAGFNAQSELRKYGYCVDKKTNRSRKERQELLATIIEHELIPVPEIVQSLERDISLHPGESYDDARKKWAEDVRFVKEYALEHNKFMIAKK